MPPWSPPGRGLRQPSGALTPPPRTPPPPPILGQSRRITNSPPISCETKLVCDTGSSRIPEEIVPGSASTTVGSGRSSSKSLPARHHANRAPPPRRHVAERSPSRAGEGWGEGGRSSHAQHKTRVNYCAQFRSQLNTPGTGRSPARRPTAGPSQTGPARQPRTIPPHYQFTSNIL